MREYRNENVVGAMGIFNEKPIRAVLIIHGEVMAPKSEINPGLGDIVSDVVGTLAPSILSK